MAGEKYKGKYTNDRGELVDAVGTIEYVVPGFLGGLRQALGKTPTDTVITMRAKEVPYAVSQKITRSPDGVTTERFDNSTGEYVPQINNSYWDNNSMEFYNSATPIIPKWKQLGTSIYSYVTTPKKHQQGGTVQSEAQQQRQFIQFLMQEAEQEGFTIQSQEDLKNYIQKLGEEGFKEKQQKFLMLIKQSSQQSGTPVAAEQGTKLNYIEKTNSTGEKWKPKNQSGLQRGNNRYTTQYGDTLYQIAKDYNRLNNANISADDLMSVLGITDSTKLQTGVTIDFSKLNTKPVNQAEKWDQQYIDEGWGKGTDKRGQWYMNPNTGERYYEDGARYNSSTGIFTDAVGREVSRPKLITKEQFKQEYRKRNPYNDLKSMFSPSYQRNYEAEEESAYKKLRDKYYSTWYKQGGAINSIDYLKELKGICPEGYLATGGKCKPCERAKKGAQLDNNPVSAFKRHIAEKKKK